MAIWLSLFILLLSFYLMSEIVDKRFVKSLDNIANWLNLSNDVAGATLLALGTSAPEISTALIALFLENANPATGVGTIVGSAIFQILVVIGFAAIVRTCYLNWKIVLRDSLFYIFSVVLLLIFINDNAFELWEAIFLVSSYFLYLLLLFVWMRYSKDTDSSEEHRPMKELEDNDDKRGENVFQKIRRYITYPVDFLLSIIPDVEKKPNWTIPVFFISLAIIGYACYWLVLAAESLAETVGIPPAIIALTILAGGSSIPEMISSAIVAKQGRGNMAIANAIGSNTFDILMSLGLPVLIFIIWTGKPLQDLGGKDIYNSIILLFASLILVLGLLFATKFKATRTFGIILMVVYIVYVWAAYAGWIGA